MKNYFIYLKNKDKCSCGNLLFEASENEVDLKLKCVNCGITKWIHKKKLKITDKNKFESDPRTDEKRKEMDEKSKVMKGILGIMIANGSNKICPKCRKYRSGFCTLKQIIVESNEVCKDFGKLYTIETIGIKVVQGGKVSSK